MGLLRDIMIGLVILGIILLVVGGLIGFVLFVKQGLGIVLIIFGVFMMIGFPEVGEYQPSGFSWAGVLIGLIMIALGIWLIFF
jgi:hypothetical protein